MKLRKRSIETVPVRVKVEGASPAWGAERLSRLPDTPGFGGQLDEGFVQEFRAGK